MNKRLFEHVNANSFKLANEIAFSGQDVGESPEQHLSKLTNELKDGEYTLGFGKSSEGWYLLSQSDLEILKDEFGDNFAHQKVNNPESQDSPFIYFTLEQILQLNEYGYHIILKAGA